MNNEIENNPGTSFDKLRELDAYFDKQLKNYSRYKGLTVLSAKKSVSFKKWIGRLALLVLFLSLPFIVLIRTSLFTYSRYELNGWLALGAGITATILLLLMYGVCISFKFNGRAKIHRYVAGGIAGLVLVYCCYGLLYLSGMNAKNEEVRSYYRSLHPILRVTITTATLADSDLIITDMQRSPGDYVKMGLTPRQHSLHYKQPTGYVHAVDLRTIGRAEWKNWLTRQALNLLGYETLRHLGTADHLHVALPLND